MRCNSFTNSLLKQEVFEPKICITSNLRNPQAQGSKILVIKLNIEAGVDLSHAVNYCRVTVNNGKLPHTKKKKHWKIFT